MRRSDWCGMRRILSPPSCTSIASGWWAPGVPPPCASPVSGSHAEGVSAARACSNRCRCAASASNRAFDCSWTEGRTPGLPSTSPAASHSRHRRTLLSSSSSNTAVAHCRPEVASTSASKGETRSIGRAPVVPGNRVRTPRTQNDRRKVDGGGCRHRRHKRANTRFSARSPGVGRMRSMSMISLRTSIACSTSVASLSRGVSSGSPHARQLARHIEGDGCGSPALTSISMHFRMAQSIAMSSIWC